MERRQFHVLYRQFLFRTIDLELLSASAHGDIGKLLGQFASLLIFAGSLVGIGALFFQGGDPIAVWRIVNSLISTTMLVVGLFAVLSWDAMFPDRRDVLVLAPLPVRPRTLFLAKVAAVATSLGLTIAAFHILAAFTWPLVLGAPRSFPAYWITMLSSGAFVFCSMLTVQGAAALLPRQQFLRVSAFLQTAAFCLLLLGYFLQPPITNAKSLNAWLPSHWFLGLFQTLNGTPHPELTPLAWRAAAGFTIALAGAVLMFLLSYFRISRKIVEEPDIAPGTRGGRWLPRFGDSPLTAIVQFSIRTLLRSRQHRLILSFFLGLAFAVVMLYVKTPLAQKRLASVVNTPMLAASIIVMLFAVIGMRVTFAMPIDLRANWIFRVANTRGLPDALRATRRSMFISSVAPVWMIWGAVLFSLWPWEPAAVHLAVLGLAAAILVELCLLDFGKIPFTCSYLPGKANVYYLVFAYTFLLGPLLHGAAELERRMLARPGGPAMLLVVLSVPLILLRRRTLSRTDREEIRFEEVEPPAVQVLGLQRD